MKNNDKLIILKECLKANIPVLTDFLTKDDFPSGTVLSSKCSLDDLTGHYEKENYLPPKWYQELLNSKMLIIDSLDKIDLEEQLKFMEILKYHQVSTFSIPLDTLIIITAEKIDRTTINKEIYSLVAHIEGK